MAVLSYTDFDHGQELARGSFGRVLVVRHKASNGIFALKMVEKQRVRWESLKNEVALHHRLRHPNIVRFYRYFENPDEHCLLLQLADNGSLHNLVEEQPLEEKMTIKLFREITTGLEYLHSMEIVHRDLKPLNVLLDNNGVALIADFGSAIDLAKNVAFGDMGTPAYSAPEAKAFEEEYGVQADIWSLGATLVHMTTCRVPTSARLLSEEERMEAIPATISADCHHLLSALLQVSPAARPSATQVLDHCWLSTK